MSETAPKGSLEGRPPASGFFGRLLALLTGRVESENRSMESAIQDFLGTGHALAPGEREILLNLASFGELRVDDVMVPRADIVGVESSASLAELASVFREAQHSRLPVYRETLDDPLGMVHVKDVMALLVPKDFAQSAPTDNILKRIRRDVLFVPPSMRVVDLLIKMQKSRIHMALVIDEYGGTDGLVTIEDLVEEIVGDIEDEHDIDEGALLIARPDGGYDASARLPYEDLERVLGPLVLPEDRQEGVDTLGGLLFSLVGRVPQRSELISHPAGVDFEVLDSDPRRVKKVRIHIRERPDTAYHPLTDDQDTVEKTT
jgi:CBS domain containing-hemolysin-like protein